MLTSLKKIQRKQKSSTPSSSSPERAKRNNANREFGKSFEEAFVKRAQSAGLLPLKNPLAAKFVGAGKLQLISADLDFKLIHRTRGIALIDCKTYDSDYFTYSQLNPKQVELASLYNRWGVSAGFLVWFRPVDRVCFFPGWEIEEIGSGSRFTPNTLTGLLEFDPLVIFAAPTTRRFSDRRSP